MSEAQGQGRKLSRRGPPTDERGRTASPVVLGPAVSLDWRSIDLADHQVTGRINQGPDHLGIGRNVLGDPRFALQWIGNELSGQGITLRAGLVVATGACMIPMEIAPGDHLSRDKLSLV